MGGLKRKRERERERERDMVTGREREREGNRKKDIERDEERQRKTECVAVCCRMLWCAAVEWHAGTHCNALQRTTTHCNALQRTATHCNALQHTATLEGKHLTLQHNAIQQQHNATHCTSAKDYNAATHRNSRQHTVTNSNNQRHH